MNWKSIAFDWNQVRAFLVTAEEGSLSAAARALGLTQPTIGRQVTALEEELETALFERVGNSLQLTRSGLELLEHVRAMGEAASRISLTATGQSQAISGKVAISASDVASAVSLPGFVAHLHQHSPLIEIEIIAENQISDLLRREADIAIRHVRPDQPDLIARLAGEGSAHFYAAKSYLNRNGQPGSVDDLKSHTLVGYGDNSSLIQQFTSLGIELNERQFQFNSPNGIVAWELAKSGLGIAVMSDGVAARSPEMVRLELGHQPILFPIWLATHRELHTSRRIRTVFDTLAEYIKTHLL